MFVMDSAGGDPMTLGGQSVEVDKEKEMLDLINRVQMFQIASSKVN